VGREYHVMQKKKTGVQVRFRIFFMVNKIVGQVGTKGPKTRVISGATVCFMGHIRNG
jgi:hypothetical protein